MTSVEGRMEIDMVVDHGNKPVKGYVRLEVPVIRAVGTVSCVDRRTAGVVKVTVEIPEGPCDNVAPDIGWLVTLFLPEPATTRRIQAQTR